MFLFTSFLILLQGPRSSFLILRRPPPPFRCGPSIFTSEVRPTPHTNYLRPTRPSPAFTALGRDVFSTQLGCRRLHRVLLRGALRRSRPFVRTGSIRTPPPTRRSRGSQVFLLHAPSRDPRVRSQSSTPLDAGGTRTDGARVRPSKPSLFCLRSTPNPPPATPRISPATYSFCPPLTPSPFPTRGSYFPFPSVH